MRKEKIIIGNNSVADLNITSSAELRQINSPVVQEEPRNLIRASLYHYPLFDFQFLMQLLPCVFAIKLKLNRPNLSQKDSLSGDELKALFDSHITAPIFKNEFQFEDFSYLYSEFYDNVALDKLIRDVEYYLSYNEINESNGLLSQTIYDAIEDNIKDKNIHSILISSGSYFLGYYTAFEKKFANHKITLRTTDIIGQSYYQLLSLKNTNISLNTEIDLDRITQNEQFDLIITIENNSIKNKAIKGKLEYKEFSRNINLFCFANLIKNLTESGKIIGFWSDETLISENYNKAFKDFVKNKIYVNKIKKIASNKLNHLIISPYQIEASKTKVKRITLEDDTLTGVSPKEIEYKKFNDADSFSFVQYFENFLKGKVTKLSSIADIVRGATFGTNNTKGKYQTVSTSVLSDDGIDFPHLPYVNDGDLVGKKVENYLLEDLDLIIVIRSSTIKIEVYLEKYAAHKVLCNTTQVALRFHNPSMAVYFKHFFCSDYGLKLLESLSRSGKSKAYNINPAAIGELQVPVIDTEVAEDYCKKYLKMYERFYGIQKDCFKEHFENKQKLKQLYEQLSK